MTQGRTLELSFELSHPPQKVWRALTEPELLERWLTKTDLSPEIGRAFRFQMDPSEYWDGIVSCEILESDAPHVLSYTWRALGVDTVVTWTLEATPAGTLLKLEQRGFKPEQTQAFGGARGGWRQMAGEALPALLADIS